MTVYVRKPQQPFGKTGRGDMVAWIEEPRAGINLLRDDAAW